MEISEYKAIINGGVVQSLEKRECGENEVCVKIKSVPINPIDEFKIHATEEILKTLPPYPGIGFDAVGKVVEAGTSVDTSIKGRKVAVYQTLFDPNYSGTWRQYLYCSADDVYVLPDDVDEEQSCCYVGNPLTVLGLYAQCLKYNARAIIQDAACSSVGKMFYKYATSKGLPVINIVRSDRQVEILQDLGCEYILNSKSDSFINDLSKIVDNLQANVFLECVGSSMVTDIMRKMPFGSTIVFYGTLAPEQLDITTPELLFGQKTLTYFGCPFWLKTLTKEQKAELVKEIIEHLKGIFGYKIYKHYNYKDVMDALAEYSRKSSEGKLILSFADTPDEE